MFGIKIVCLLFITLLVSLSFGASEYVITSPKDGDTYYFGDTVTIKMASTGMVTAGIEIVMGKRSVSIPNNMGFNGPFTPSSKTEIKFVIPSFYLSPVWVDSLQSIRDDTVTMAYDACQIRMFAYNAPSETFALSDGFFKISDKTATLKNLIPKVAKPGAKNSKYSLTNSITEPLGTIYSINGKNIFSSRKSSQAQLLRIKVNK